MMKIIFVLSVVLSFNTFAGGFDGCGEYIFKGVLKPDDHVPFKVMYIVNENTKSQMIFHMQEMDDMKKLALFINLPTTFKASITKPMDGTKGELTFPYDIGKRLPDPLTSKDTGITKIKNFKCN